MTSSLRRLLVLALFMFAGALSIDGAHAQAGCTTPDPFKALGGGTCYRGGWFPPGMALPGGGSAPTTSPAPSAQPSRCSTPDPFAALGGGTCYRGGWFPPGMAIPDDGGGSSVSPAPSGTAAPPSGCVTPDPFAALGGGTCYGGGWLPPGMAIPGGQSASVPAPSGSGAAAPEPISSSGAVGLRVLEWNLHHGVGTDGRYDLDRIATWMAAMKPDVIMLNEVEKNTWWGNEDQPARYEALLEAKTGRNWYHMFTQEFGDSSADGKGHVILSVYPFDSVSRTVITPSDGLLGAGAAGEASITVNGRHISLVVAHLDPDSQPMRLTQAGEVIAWASTYMPNRIIAGDMNAWPDQSSIAEFDKTYSDSWAVAASRGTAQAVAGISPSGATKNGRIDYIFYSKDASQLVLTASKVFDTRDASGYMPSDHRPVVSTFEVR